MTNSHPSPAASDSLKAVSISDPGEDYPPVRRVGVSSGPHPTFCFWCEVEAERDGRPSQYRDECNDVTCERHRREPIPAELVFRAVGILIERRGDGVARVVKRAS